jgi:hypothetical protein
MVGLSINGRILAKAATTCPCSFHTITPIPICLDTLFRVHQDPLQLLSTGEEMIFVYKGKNCNFTPCEITIRPLGIKNRLLSS